MLGKLLKYEMKSTSRVMWFLYAAVIAVGLIIGIMIHVNVSNSDLAATTSLLGSFFGVSSIILVIFCVIYGLLLLALGVMTVIMIIIRFNSNLLKGEGYLMHTLPVPTWMLVVSKLIVSIIWMAIGTAASIISALLLGLTSGMLPYILKEDGFKSLMDLFHAIFGNHSGLYITATIISMIVLILQFYFSMAVGNLVNRYKFLLAIGVFIGIQIVLSIISSVTGLATVSMRTNDFSNGILGSYVSGLMIKNIILNLIFGTGFFVGTTLILKKRLNLA